MVAICCEIGCFAIDSAGSWPAEGLALLFPSWLWCFDPAELRGLGVQLACGLSLSWRLCFASGVD
eukprot:2878289-Prorocentrum_lima.AAC.1